MANSDSTTDNLDDAPFSDQFRPVTANITIVCDDCHGINEDTQDGAGYCPTCKRGMPPVTEPACTCQDKRLRGVYHGVNCPLRIPEWKEA